MSINSKIKHKFSIVDFSDCFVGPEFLCDNQRCIPFYLKCDGYNHCGDGSDEKGECNSNGNDPPFGRPWYTHQSNYLFPKVDHLTDLKTATIVFLATSAGLIFLIALLIIVLNRIGRHTREQRFLQQQIQTISGMLGN